MITYPMIVLGLVILYVLNSIKILREYERGVIFRLGRLLPQAKGPGIILVFPLPLELLKAFSSLTTEKK